VKTIMQIRVCVGEKMLYSLCVWVHIILLTLMVSISSSGSTN
jgi:hypothetical protein